VPSINPHRATTITFAATSFVFLLLYAAAQGALDRTRALDFLKYRHEILLLFLAGPSMFLALAILIATLLAQSQKFFSGEAYRVSASRIAAATVLLIPVFPLGLYLIILVLFAPVSLFGSNHSPDNPDAFRSKLSQLAFVVVLLVIAGVFCVVATGLASFAMTGRHPQKLWRWAFGIPTTTLLLSAAAQCAWWKVHFMDINPFRYFFGMPLDLFIGGVARLQFILLFGAPMLAAAFGHWLYPASRRASVVST
jgi:hypothetical protein